MKKVEHIFNEIKSSLSEFFTEDKDIIVAIVCFLRCTPFKNYLEEEMVNALGQWCDDTEDYVIKNNINFLELYTKIDSLNLSLVSKTTVESDYVYGDQPLHVVFKYKNNVFKINYMVDSYNQTVSGRARDGKFEMMLVEPTQKVISFYE